MNLYLLPLTQSLTYIIFRSPHTNRTPPDTENSLLASPSIDSIFSGSTMVLIVMQGNLHILPFHSTDIVCSNIVRTPLSFSFSQAH